MVSLPGRIDAETNQRYSEAQIPDLVAHAIPRILETEASRSPALSRIGRVVVFGRQGNCSLGPHTASNLPGLVFASSSAHGKGRVARGHRHCTPDGIFGGHLKH